HAQSVQSAHNDPLRAAGADACTSHHLRCARPPRQTTPRRAARSGRLDGGMGRHRQPREKRGYRCLLLRARRRQLSLRTQDGAAQMKTLKIVLIAAVLTILASAAWSRPTILWLESVSHDCTFAPDDTVRMNIRLDSIDSPIDLIGMGIRHYWQDF